MRKANQSAWVLGATEFHTIWTAVAGCRVPYPLSDVAGDVDTTVQTLRLHEDMPFVRSLVTLVKPDVRIEACTRFTHDPESCGAVFAALRGNSAVIVSQQLDTFTVESVAAYNLPRRLTALFGSVQPGRRLSVSGKRTALAEPRSRAGAVSTPLPTEFQKFFTLPRISVSEVSAHPGRLADNRPDPRGGWFFLHDVAGDGRYIVRETRQLEAFPASSQRIADEIATIINQAKSAASLAPA